MSKKPLEEDPSAIDDLKDLEGTAHDSKASSPEKMDGARKDKGKAKSEEFEAIDDLKSLQDGDHDPNRHSSKDSSSKKPGGKVKGKTKSKVGYAKEATLKQGPSQFIKLTPEEVERGIPDRKSINRLKQEKYNQLLGKLESIKSEAQETPGEMLLYRFHNDNDALVSEAEKKGQGHIEKEEKLSFLKAHSEKNQKELRDSEGRLLYSPFVSTTSDILSFVGTTFTPLSTEIAGDTNIRQDVFERSQLISVFSVPNDACYNPKSELSSQESEVCYDTDNSPLSVYILKQYDNPLKGQIEINPVDLALSREGGEKFIAKAAGLNITYNKISKKDPITSDLAKKYQEWYTEKEELCERLGSLLKKDLTKKSQQMGEEPKYPSKSSSSMFPQVQTFGRPSAVSQRFEPGSSSSPSEKPLFASSSSSSSPPESPPLPTRSSSSQLESQPDHSSSSSDAAIIAHTTSIAHTIRQNLEKSPGSVSIHDSLTPPLSPSHSASTSEKQQHKER